MTDTPSPGGQIESTSQVGRITFSTPITITPTYDPSWVVGRPDPPPQPASFVPRIGPPDTSGLSASLDRVAASLEVIAERLGKIEKLMDESLRRGCFW